MLGLWAQFKVKSAFAKYAKINTSRNVTADEVSRDILSKGARTPVSVEPTQGNLTDHYDPRSNTLRLSQSVYGSSSIAAVGIAAHECGHALQQSDEYKPLMLRTAIRAGGEVRFDGLFPRSFLIGLLASWEPLLYAGIICFAATLVFSLVTLPVEFNASKRAMGCAAKRRLHDRGRAIRGGARRIVRRFDDLCRFRDFKPAAAFASPADCGQTKIA